MRQSSNEAVTHALKVGDYAVVFALDSFGPSIEGAGVIEACDAARNRYHIRFSGERITRLRFVNPDWQSSPERSLALLIEFWRSSHRDDPSVEDFFPREK
jgi:hypothetical protein